LLALFFDPEDGGYMFPPKRQLTFNGLHGIISQKIELFVTNVVRTSNLTRLLIAPTIQFRVVESLLRNQFERVWKEVVVAKSEITHHSEFHWSCFGRP
jgi:hypothetical protein